MVGMEMEQLPNYVHPRHSTREIEIAEDTPSCKLVRSCTRGYPLPSPSPSLHASSSSYSKERQDEPTLYKKVIYIPDIQYINNQSAHQKQTDRKHRSRSPESHVFCASCNHQPEQRFDLKTSKGRENTGDHRKHPGITVLNGFRNLRCRTLKLLHLYRNQWTQRLECGRMVFAAHLIFWASFIPALVFGAWLQQKTKGSIGAAEVLVSSSICGVIFVLLGTQPLMFMGVSAPSLVFVCAVADTSHRLSLEFLPWMGCIGIWTSLILIIFALTNYSLRVACHLTLFSWEVVRMFVAMTFMWNGVEEILGFFSHKTAMDSSMLSLWLATCTFASGIILSGAQEWHYFDHQAGEVIQNYGAAFTFLLFTALPYLPKLEQIRIPRVQMGEVFYHTDKLWKFRTFVKLGDLPTWAVFLALIPGSLLATMIFVDHNATTMLIEAGGGLKVQKSISRSWDLFILAGLTCFCSLWGLPTCYGLYEQTMKHKYAMNNRQKCSAKEINFDMKAIVEVQRLLGFVVSLLTGVPLLPGIILLVQKVPLGLLAGFFLQMSISCLKELKFTWRLQMLFMDFQQQSPKEVRLYTTIQMSCVVLIFVISKTPAALLFPLFILATIWLGHYVLQQLFSERTLVMLEQMLGSCHSWNNSPAKTNHIFLSAIQSGQDYSSAQGGSIRALVAAVTKNYHSSSSSASLGSPSILRVVNSRRLKERSRRRNKRKRQTSLEAPWTLAIKTEEPKNILSKERQFNQLAQLNFQTEEPTTTIQQYSAGGKILVSQFEESDKPRLSVKSKKQSALKDSIEIHSNVLYDACWVREAQASSSKTTRNKAAILEGRYVSCSKDLHQIRSQQPGVLSNELYQLESFDSSEEDKQYHVHKVMKIKQIASTTECCSEGRSNKKLKADEA